MTKTTNKNTHEELNRIMADSLFQLKKLIDNDPDKKTDLISVTKLFLLSVISTAVDLVSIEAPEGVPYIYAEIEAIAKAQGLRNIKEFQSKHGINYSVSNIAPDDAPMAMNYLGQQLATTLFKSIHELPLQLRKPEMLLRGVEALLANLINEKFGNSHGVLDSFCDHVHMALDDLDKRRH